MSGFVKAIEILILGGVVFFLVSYIETVLWKHSLRKNVLAGKLEDWHGQE